MYPKRYMTISELLPYGFARCELMKYVKNHGFPVLLISFSNIFLQLFFNYLFIALTFHITIITSERLVILELFVDHRNL